jgi:hypothetical protein
MAGARFDIQFAGELVEGADAHEVRIRLQDLFKLSEDSADRLFGGKGVTIKRGVDAATASRFREVFRDAGALVRIVPVGAEPPPPSSAQDAALAEVAESSPGAADGEGLQLAPVGHSLPLEQEGPVQPRTIDISYLSLVPGDDWTLEDCAPPLPPAALPDIRHLDILVPEDEKAEGEDGRESP